MCALGSTGLQRKVGSPLFAFLPFVALELRQWKQNVFMEHSVTVRRTQPFPRTLPPLREHVRVEHGLVLPSILVIIGGA